MGIPPVTLTVVQVPDGSALPLGAVLSVDGPVAVLGRADDADVRIPDSTVSRRHARLELPQSDADGIQLVWLSDNGMFLDGEAVADRISVTAPLCQLQLGGVLLTVAVRADLLSGAIDVETEKVTEPVVRPTEDARAPVRWEVCWDAGQCAIRFEGTLLDLPPTPTRVLASLLERAGEPVHQWDLQEQVGQKANLAQAVSLARSAIKERLNGVDLLPYRQAVEATLGAPVGDEGVDTLMRSFIANKRGYGYLICVDPDDVRIEQK